MARKVKPDTPEQQKKIDEKVTKLVKKRYLRLPRKGEEVWVAIPYMAVDKGEKDIRVVWSCTENGVNPSIYAPRIYFPTGDSMIRRTPPSGWMGDIDSGEMFNNYMLHHSEVRYNGVEISEELSSELGLETTMLVWDRCLFGWRPAPLFAIRMFLRNIEIARRSRYCMMRRVRTHGIVWNSTYPRARTTTLE